MSQEIFFLLQSLSVFPARVTTAMDIARFAGFDGLELFRFRRFWRYPPLARYREEAASRELRLHFHEALDWDADSTHPEVRIPALWGGLLPSGASLMEQFGEAVEHVVSYTSHWREVLEHRNARPNWTLQTASKYPGVYECPYGLFEETIQQHRLPLTLDTQHLLEYQHGHHGVEGLSGFSSTLLMKRLVDFFDRHRDIVREIHLNNFDPSRGHDTGRNLWPSEGALNLREFCSHVRASGWSGTVVPELHPRFFSRVSTRENIGTARRLLDEVQECWS